MNEEAYNYYLEIYERLVLPNMEDVDLKVDSLRELRQCVDFFRSLDDIKYEDCEERLEELKNYF